MTITPLPGDRFVRDELAVPLLAAADRLDRWRAGSGDWDGAHGRTLGLLAGSLRRHAERGVVEFESRGPLLPEHSRSADGRDGRACGGDFDPQHVYSERERCACYDEVLDLARAILWKPEAQR